MTQEIAPVSQARLPGAQLFLYSKNLQDIRFDGHSGMTAHNEIVLAHTFFMLYNEVKVFYPDNFEVILWSSRYTAIRFLP